MLALTEFERRLASLRDDRSRLVQSMRQVAEGIRAHGNPPSLETIDEFQFYRQRYVDLQETCAATINVETDDLLTFEQLEAQRERLEQLESLRCSIRRVDQLQHLNSDRNGLLDAPRSGMSELVSQLDDNPLCDAVKSFEVNLHPLAKLLQLVEATTSLSDEDWETCQQSVGQAYGREVAIAAARGHLKFGMETPEQRQAVYEDSVHCDEEE